MTKLCVIDMDDKDCSEEDKKKEAEKKKAFSWKDDFGRPEVMIDALGAQTSLEPVDPPEE